MQTSFVWRFSDIQNKGLASLIGNNGRKTKVVGGILFHQLVPDDGTITTHQTLFSTPLCLGGTITTGVTVQIEAPIVYCIQLKPKRKNIGDQALRQGAPSREEEGIQAMVYKRAHEKLANSLYASNRLFFFFSGCNLYIANTICMSTITILRVLRNRSFSLFSHGVNIRCDILVRFPHSIRENSQAIGACLEMRRSSPPLSSQERIYQALF